MILLGGGWEGSSPSIYLHDFRGRIFNFWLCVVACQSQVLPRGSTLRGWSWGKPLLKLFCSLVNIWTPMFPSHVVFNNNPCSCISMFVYWLKMWLGIHLGVRLHFLWEYFLWKISQGKGWLVSFLGYKGADLTSWGNYIFLYQSNPYLDKVLDVLPPYFVCVGLVLKFLKAVNSWLELIDFSFAPKPPLLYDALFQYCIQAGTSASSGGVCV